MLQQELINENMTIQQSLNKQKFKKRFQTIQVPS